MHQSRRHLLKLFSTTGIIAGSTLPDRWTKPIIQSIVLPAHAQTSETAIDTPPSSPPNLSSISVTGACLSQPTLFYRISFSNEPAIPNSGVTITLLGTITTGFPVPEGDTLFLFIGNNIQGLTVVSVRSDTAGGIFSFNWCDTPSTDIVQEQVPLIGGSTLEFTLERGVNDGFPMVELSEFSVV